MRHAQIQTKTAGARGFNAPPFATTLIDGICKQIDWQLRAPDTLRARQRPVVLALQNVVIVDHSMHGSVCSEPERRAVSLLLWLA